MIFQVLDLLGLRKNLRLKPLEMKKIQTKKLREIVWHAYWNVPFYHAKFREAGIKPEDVRTVEDLARIPTTTKSEMQAVPLKEMIARNVDVNKCLRNRTSGSTGIPLVILEDERAVSLQGATFLRAFFEDGLRLSDKKAVICDPRSFPKRKKWTQYLGIMRKEYLSIFDDAHKQLSFLENYAVDAIESYPSSLVILADLCRQWGHNVKPRVVFTLAEVLDRQTRKLISTAFECELFDYYGSTEFGLMAWECREYSGYHMNADSLIMEFLKDGEIAAPGERGEIVCTTLINHAMPLIRYRIGDIGVPVGEQCSCGITLPLMAIMEGREDDFLVATDGRIIPPTVFFPYPFKDFEGIRQFRVVQEKRDQLTIQIAAKENFLVNGKMLETAKMEIQKLFGENMQVDFRIVDKIDRDSSGKLRKVVSNFPAKSASLK